MLVHALLNMWGAHAAASLHMCDLSVAAHAPCVTIPPPWRASNTASGAREDTRSALLMLQSQGIAVSPSRCQQRSAGCCTPAPMPTPALPPCVPPSPP